MCFQESGNPHDTYTVVIKKGNLVVGHVPRKISAVCSLFLRAGTITATVTDSRRYSNDLPQGGLEVPCVLKFCGEARTIDKVRRLLPANKEQDSVRIIIGGLNIGDFCYKSPKFTPRQYFVLYGI